MADLGNISFGIQVRGDRDIAKAVSSLDNMQKKLAQVALAERQGAVATGTLAKSTKQLQNALARQTGDLIGATKAANSYRRQLEAMTDAQLGATVGMQGSLKGFRNIELFAQQAGYQIGDFAVQVQSGTNPLVAFSQQSSQLLGFMGSYGAIFGAAIAILGGVATAFFNAGDAAKSFDDTLSDATSAIDEARSAYDLTQLSLGELREKYGSVNEELRTFLELQTQAQEARALQSTLEILGSIREEMRGAFSTETNSLMSMFNVNIGVANQLFQNLRRAVEATTLEDQLEQVVQLRTRVLDLVGGVENMDEEQRNFYLKLLDAEDVLRTMKGLSKDVADNTGDAAREAFNFAAVGGLNPRDPSQIPGEGAAIATQQQRIEELRAQWQAYQDSLKENERTARRSVVRPNQEIADSIKEINSLSESMADSFGKAFTSVIDGTSSVKDAFKSMARSIISELYQVFFVKRITGFISDALSTAFTGGLAPSTSPVPTPRPSTFASGGYMTAGRPALVGENGPELIFPNRQSTVMNADLTKKALGGGGETIVINQTINVSTGVQQTVRNEIKSMMPQISNAAKGAVLDAKRRGGGYGRAFE